MRNEPTPHFPAAARTQEITRAPGPVSAQRLHRLAQPWRRVTSSNSAAGWRHMREQESLLKDEDLGTRTESSWL